MRILVALLVSGAFAVTGCGGQNDCERLLETTYNAWSDACSGKSGECCYCKCWNDGHRMNDYDSSTKACECNIAMPDHVPDDSCTDAYKAQVQSCYDNEPLCVEGLKAQATSQCTASPLQ